MKHNITPKQDWHTQLNLDQAVPRGGQMVQQLTDGTRIVLTLVPNLQKWAREYLRSYDLPFAAMVMLEVSTGRVLVMAGHSSARPTVDTEQLCLTPWAPTASIYKLITASALLDQGVASDTKICYHGGFRAITLQNLKDNPKLDRSCDTLSTAIAKSVNPIMGKLTLRHLKQETMEKWSYRFGFNRPIPFDLPVQPSTATIPTGELERARVGAGFWHTQSSALHGSLIAAVAASRGLFIGPRIVESVQKPKAQAITPPPPKPERVMSPQAAEQLARMMVSTTTIGTARPSFHNRKGQPLLPGIDVGGKTGSLSRHKPFLHYNWFVGFAPADRPRVAFAVLLGNPPRWRIKAHQAAQVLLSRYFFRPTI